MAPFLFLCFLLTIITNTLLCHAQISVQSISAPSSNTPAESPSNIQRTNEEEPFIGRKFGKQQHKQFITSSTSSPTPSEAPQSEKIHSSSEGSIPSHQKTSVLDSQGGVHLVTQHHHHHSFDKSVAGGGVILGGLATTFLVSIFCYIRATGRHKLETTA